jgi:hypothetical protein
VGGQLTKELYESGRIGIFEDLVDAPPGDAVALKQGPEYLIESQLWAGKRSGLVSQTETTSHPDVKPWPFLGSKKNVWVISGKYQSERVGRQFSTPAVLRDTECHHLILSCRCRTDEVEIRETSKQIPSPFNRLAQARKRL